MIRFSLIEQLFVIPIVLLSEDKDPLLDLIDVVSIIQ